MTVADGSAESFDDSIAWVALNVGDYTPEQWDTARARADSFGVRVLPWARLAHVELGQTLDDVISKLELLVDTAYEWGSDWILPNYEKECETIPPADVADALKQTGWDRETAWSTESWLPNSVDFSPIYDDPVLLQIFPEAMQGVDPPVSKETIGQYIRHARDKGFTYVGVTLQTYQQAEPSWYPLDWTHSVYPGNEIHHGEWESWFPK